MPQFEACLQQAVAEKKISEKTAKRYMDLFREAEKEAAQMGKGGVDGYTFATSKAAERMLQQVGQKKADIAANILRIERAIEDVQGHSTSLFEGLRAKLGENIRGGGVKDSLVAQQRAALGAMQSRLTDFLEQIRSKNFGLTRDIAHARDMVKELYGVDSGSASAKANAQAWKETNAWWLQMMDAEKVRIAKMEDWFLPQQFNTLKLRAMEKDGFVQAMMERWQDGRLRLRDWKGTGAAVFDPSIPKDAERVKEIVGNAYDNIVTGGANAIEPGISTKESMGKRYSRRRVFDWTSADAYFDFLDTFGNGADNLGDQFTRHLHQQAKDLGTARVLGGDPDHTAQTLIQFGQKNGISKSQIDTLETTYFIASGQSGDAKNVTMANSAQALRSWLSGAQLGGAALGSAPDFAFMKMTAQFNGLPFTKVMANYLGGVDRRTAMQLGMINETGLRGLRDHFDETLTANIGRPNSPLKRGEMMEAASAGLSRIGGQAAEFVMRATGLDWHSNQGRNAIGMGFLAELADQRGKAFASLPDRNRAFLERYGIDAGQWDLLRTKAIQGEKLFMDPAFLAFRGTAPEREAALRLLGAIDAEQKMAIPEGSVATRAIMLGNTQPGTFAGEARRMVQYKGFALSVGMFHGYRMLDNMMGRTPGMARGQYLAFLAIEATVLGALSYQLKNIAAGKDPESMETVAFWGKAAAMGGAGGMLGDMVKTFFQTQSADDAARLVSPALGLAVNTAALTGGNFAQMMHGDKTNTGREASRYLRQYALPRLWYTNLAVDRLGFDTLQRAWDPDASGAFVRMQQRQMRETGTQFWWRPGSTSPARMPNLEAALP